MSLVRWLLALARSTRQPSPPVQRDEHGYRLDNPVCWSCHRRHTGSVWCPHCNAPVAINSPEARSSVFWAQDPRNTDRLHPTVNEILAQEDARLRDDLQRARCCQAGAKAYPDPCPWHDTDPDNDREPFGSDHLRGDGRDL